jgi:LmbE family N-acetylglucosaminyl deacetylase
MDMPAGHATPLLVISPHLDDGVLGCGEMLAAQPRSVVLSLFAGPGQNPAVRTDWDAACGFTSARHALEVREAEDDAALGMLHALPSRLKFPDHQYRQAGERVDVDELAGAIRDAVNRYQPHTIALPFGLFHRDHALAHEASVRVAREARGYTWLAYEDAFYRRIPGLLQQQLCVLASAGWVVTPVPALEQRKRVAKRRAVQCYASQLRGLDSPGRPGRLDAFAPEGYWRLSCTA